MATLFPCKEFSKQGMSCVGNLGLLLCVNARATCALTGVPAKGAWSQFSCQERLRLSTKSWKNGWVSLNTEKPTMLTRWSATSSSRSKVNSCRARKQEGDKQRDRNRLLDGRRCLCCEVSFCQIYDYLVWISTIDILEYCQGRKGIC